MMMIEEEEKKKIRRRRRWGGGGERGGGGIGEGGEEEEEEEEEEVTEHRIYVLIFSTTFRLKYFSLYELSAIQSKTCTGLHLKHRLLLSNF